MNPPVITDVKTQCISNNTYFQSNIHIQKLEYESDVEPYIVITGLPNSNLTLNAVQFEALKLAINSI